jgi:ubiquinone/menaquinone biosynthesis C-methylase UbiE
VDRDFVRYQAEHHPLIQTDRFETLEEYCLHLMQRKAYEEAALLTEGKIALDLGCNNGWGTRIIGKVARHVIGVDVSQAALIEANRFSSPDNIEFRKVDGDRLPFADHEFDVVVSCQVIEHVADYTPYLGEVCRVLKEGGTAVFTTPNASIRLDEGMKPWFPFHVREFNGKQLGFLLRQWFDRVEVKGLFASPELYAIEFQRVQRSREAARRRLRAWLPPYVELKARAIDAVKSVLPEPVERSVRRMVRQWFARLNKARPRPSIDPSSFTHFSLADLHYRSGNLDEALDLMAICHKSIQRLPEQPTT